ITNASLLDIEGGIGTGVDNGAWISTSYLIGEIVVIPLTDFLSRVFSFRRYMIANAILFPIFSIGCALFAISVTFAPAIGPTIGGYLTENYGWQTIFFINALPSAIMVVALAFTLDPAPMQLSLLKEGDWIGIGTMAIGLSALQTVL